MEYSNGNSQGQDPRSDPRLFSSNYKNYVKSAPPALTSFTYDLSMPSTTLLEMKTDDELFVENWLSSKGKINLNLDITTTTGEILNKKSQHSTKQSKPKGHLAIHSAKAYLRKCLEITSRLEATQKILQENVASMSSDEWKRHTIEIGGLKDELTMLMTQFQHPEVLNTLKYEIGKRSKKRVTQKRKRLEDKLQLAKNKELNLAQHKKIDLWLVAKKEEAERAKAEELMKKDADCVLAEVTKKKSEARKQLSLLASLIKLRNVRETAAKARGEKIPDIDNAAFSKTTETLVKIWEDSMRTYSKEEQGLRLMLEQNVNEGNKQTEVNKEREVMKQWDLALFGPVYPYKRLYWAFTEAQRDMEKFIAIRRSWDTFLNTDKDKPRGSKIPIGWVAPEANPNLEWSRYRKNAFI